MRAGIVEIEGGTVDPIPRSMNVITSLSSSLFRPSDLLLTLLAFTFRVGLSSWKGGPGFSEQSTGKKTPKLVIPYRGRWVLGFVLARISYGTEGR